MAGELLELAIGNDNALRARVTRRFYEVIASSFRQNNTRITHDEVKRRFVILETALRELRAEHGWAFTRILDTLPEILQCKLNGVFWDPTKQPTLWSPS